MNTAARTHACPSLLPESAAAEDAGQGLDQKALSAPMHAESQQQADEGRQASKRQAAGTEQQKGKRARVDQHVSSSGADHDEELVLQEQDIGWDDDNETSSRGNDEDASAADSPAGFPPLHVPISRPEEDYSPSRSLDVHALAAFGHADADAQVAEPPAAALRSMGSRRRVT